MLCFVAGRSSVKGLSLLEDTCELLARMNSVSCISDWLGESILSFCALFTSV